MRHLGYTRVSTRSHDAKLQVDALVKSGVQERDIFADVTSGSRTRPSIATLHRLAIVDAQAKELPAPSYATVRQIVQALDPALSRAICGYMVFTGAPAAINTALALRQAIWRKTDPAWAMCGIPDNLHIDHGSDFISHHLERTAVALHIRIIHSTVGRPQGRGKIERFFGTINTALLAALPDHLGTQGGTLVAAWCTTMGGVHQGSSRIRASRRMARPPIRQNLGSLRRRFPERLTRPALSGSASRVRGGCFG